MEMADEVFHDRVVNEVDEGDTSFEKSDELKKAEERITKMSGTCSSATPAWNKDHGIVELGRRASTHVV